MNTLARALRHLTTTRRFGKRVFPVDTLSAIQSTIASGETVHRAEIRVIIEPSLHLWAILDGVTPRARAHALFAHYRIWDTEENCGLLIYINLADRQVEIVADRGVARLIAADDWCAVCNTMTAGFAQGDYHRSVTAGLRQLNALLYKYLPESNLQPDQLSNLPILL